MVFGGQPTFFYIDTYVAVSSGTNETISEPHVKFDVTMRGLQSVLIDPGTEASYVFPSDI